MNGYAGNPRTWINEDEPNTSYGGDDTRESDAIHVKLHFTDNQGQALPRLTRCSVKMMPPAPFRGVDHPARLTLELQDDVDAVCQSNFYVHSSGALE